MDEQKKARFVNESKVLAKYFECDICIKIFGIVVWEWHFPPKS